jgi:hypothetical protein
MIRKFRRLGFEGPVSGGKHAFMMRGALKVRIPNQDIEDVSLLREILRQASVTEDEWMQA